MSEIEADDEDDDEDFSSGRQSRIEELAKKIMEEKSHLAEIERQQQEQNKRDPINLNVELDTVSERSEIEDEDALRQSKYYSEKKSPGQKLVKSNKSISGIFF